MKIFKILCVVVFYLLLTFAVVAGIILGRIQIISEILIVLYVMSYLLFFYHFRKFFYVPVIISFIIFFTVLYDFWWKKCQTFMKIRMSECQCNGLLKQGVWGYSICIWERYDCKIRPTYQEELQEVRCEKLK